MCAYSGEHWKFLNSCKYNESRVTTWLPASKGQNIWVVAMPTCYTKLSEIHIQPSWNSTYNIKNSCLQMSPAKWDSIWTGSEWVWADGLEVFKSLFVPFFTFLYFSLPFSISFHTILFFLSFLHLLCVSQFFLFLSFFSGLLLKLLLFVCIPMIW